MKGTFEDGFVAGWRSVMGAEAEVPSVPVLPASSDVPEYIQGFTKGIEAANKARENGKSA